MNLSTLISQAAANTEGFRVASVNLANGGTLFCSVRKRASNSRGANRGRHDFIEFNYRAPGEKYSKRCSKKAAAALVNQG